MTIDNFFTWEMLATFAGCMAATMILTEFVKKLWEKAPAQLVSFVFAMVILVVGQIATGKFSANEILLDIVNAVTISLASNGGFDAVKRIFVGEEEDADMVGTIVLDQKDKGNSYVQFNSEPDALEDGQNIAMKVKKV